MDGDVFSPDQAAYRVGRTAKMRFEGLELSGIPQQLANPGAGDDDQQQSD
jgi:hypothetical protein